MNVIKRTNKYDITECDLSHFLFTFRLFYILSSVSGFEIFCLFVSLRQISSFSSKRAAENKVLIGWAASEFVRFFLLRPLKTGGVCKVGVEWISAGNALRLIMKTRELNGLLEWNNGFALPSSLVIRKHTVLFGTRLAIGSSDSNIPIPPRFECPLNYGNLLINFSPFRNFRVNIFSTFRVLSPKLPHPLQNRIAYIHFVGYIEWILFRSSNKIFIQ